MSGQSDKPAAAPAQQPAATFTQADIDRARAEGAAQASTAAAETATKEATAKATAESKARIKAITESDEGKQRPALANRLAFDTDMTAEAAVALMAPLPKEVQAAVTATTNTLHARMQTEAPNPVVGAAAQPDEGGEDAEAIGKRIAGYANSARIRTIK